MFLAMKPILLQKGPFKITLAGAEGAASLVAATKQQEHR